MRPVSLAPENAPSITDPGRSLSLGRVADWLGVFGLGAFLLFHLGVYGAAIFGVEKTTRALAFFYGAGQLVDATVVMVTAALLFPIARAAKQGFGGERDEAWHSLRVFWLFRVAAVGALLFLLFHLWQVRMRSGAVGHDAALVGVSLASHLSHTFLGVPWFALLVTLGVLCTCALWALFAYRYAYERRELARDRHQRRFLQIAFIAAATLVALFGMSGVVAFATGTRIGGTYLPTLPTSAPSTCPTP